METPFSVLRYRRGNEIRFPMRSNVPRTIGEKKEFEWNFARISLKSTKYTIRIPIVVWSLRRTSAVSTTVKRPFAKLSKRLLLTWTYPTPLLYVKWSFVDDHDGKERHVLVETIRDRAYVRVSSFSSSIHMVYWDSKIRGVVRLVGSSGQVVHQARITFLKGTKIARPGSLQHDFVVEKGFSTLDFLVIFCFNENAWKFFCFFLVVVSLTLCGLETQIRVLRTSYGVLWKMLTTVE